MIRFRKAFISLVKEAERTFPGRDGLKFIGSSVKRPVISDICHVEGIVVNILGSDRAGLQLAGRRNVCVHFAAARNGREDI